MIKWNMPYPELLMGSTSGIWRFNEVTGLLENVWPWRAGSDQFGWDATCIATLGDGILYGHVTYCGSASGQWLWTTAGPIRLTSECNTPSTWTDQTTGKYGEGIRMVKAISATQSVMIGVPYEGGSSYSFDDWATVQGLVGSNTNGTHLYVDSFFVYSGSNIIVKTYGDDGGMLYIGELGGTFYPLNCPTSVATSFNSFFYSPTLRMLIIGDATRDEMYYTTLPAPGSVLPELSIANGVIVSYPLEYSNAVVQASSDLSGTNWTDVTIPRVTIGDSIQLALPTDSAAKFFRMVVAP